MTHGCSSHRSGINQWTCRVCHLTGSDRLVSPKTAQPVLNTAPGNKPPATKQAQGTQLSRRCHYKRRCRSHCHCCCSCLCCRPAAAFCAACLTKTACACCPCWRACCCSCSSSASPFCAFSAFSASPACCCRCALRSWIATPPTLPESHLSGWLAAAVVGAASLRLRPAARLPAAAPVAS